MQKNLKINLFNSNNIILPHFQTTCTMQRIYNLEILSINSVNFLYVQTYAVKATLDISLQQYYSRRDAKSFNSYNDVLHYWQLPAATMMNWQLIARRLENMNYNINQHAQILIAKWSTINLKQQMRWVFLKMYASQESNQNTLITV